MLGAGSKISSNGTQDLFCFVVACFELVQERGRAADEEVAAVLAGAHIYFGIK